MLRNICGYFVVIVLRKHYTFRPIGAVGTAARTRLSDFWDFDDFDKLSVEKKNLRIRQKLTELEIQFPTIAYVRSFNGFFLFSIFTFFATESQDK